MLNINNFINKILDKVANDKKRHFIYFLCLLFFFLLLSYFSFPISTGHDYLYHIRRLTVLADAISKGYLPSYLDYTNINNYGYSPNIFYSDFTLIPFATIGIITGCKTAYIIMIYTMSYLCGIFSYLFISRISKNHFIAAIGAILYTFSFYKLEDTYERSAIGETLCFTFIPILFWGLYEIIKGNKKRWYLLTFGMGLMLFTHPPTSLICGVFIAILIIIFYKDFLKDKSRILYMILSVISTLFLTSYYFFPMLEMMSSTTFNFQYNSNYASGSPIHEIVWGMFLGILPRIKTKFLVGCGIAITMVLILRLFITNKNRDLCKKGDIFLIMGFLCLIIISRIYPWHTFPFNLLGLIQFSWRIYSLTSFFWSIAGAIYLYIALYDNIKRLKIGLPYVGIMCSLIIIGSGKEYQNLCENEKQKQKLCQNSQIIYPLYGAGFVPNKMQKEPEKYTYKRGDSIHSAIKKTKTTNLVRNNNILSFTETTFYPDTLELPLTYYLGYTAKLNGQKIEVTESNNGLVQIPIDQSGNIKVWYEGTKLQKISWYISLFCIFSLCCYMVIEYKNRNKSIS